MRDAFMCCKKPCKLICISFDKWGEWSKAFFQCSKCGKWCHDEEEE